jgi:hypothetical protein
LSDWDWIGLVVEHSLIVVVDSDSHERLALFYSKITLFDTHTQLGYENWDLSVVGPGYYLVRNIEFALDLELSKDGNMAACQRELFYGNKRCLTYSEGK